MKSCEILKWERILVGNLLMERKMVLENFDTRMENFIEENLNKISEVVNKVCAYSLMELLTKVNGEMIISLVEECILQRKVIS